MPSSAGASPSHMISRAVDVTAPTSSTFGQRLTHVARDIKISHTLFAMPWAILAAFLAARDLPNHAPHLGQIVLVVVCMVTARTVAMALNRLLDARLDARNPRTAARAVPAGNVSSAFMGGVASFCAVCFVAGCAGFYLLYQNPWPLILSVPVLLFLSAYPLLKRFTRWCHYYLGAALALAPVCAWVAVRGSVELTPFIMAGAVLLWTAGFDIIYACQDYQSDVACGVFSVPAKIGIGPALWVSRVTHVACVVMLVLLGWWSPELGLLYFIGVAAAVGLLVVEHGLVRPDDLSKVNLAFFTLNGIISLVLGTLGVIDVFV